MGLHRRRVAQGDEEQEVVAKQAIHAQAQRGQRYPPLAQVKPRQRQGDQAAAQQRQPREQERRHMRQRHTQGRQCGPQADGAQGRQRGRRQRRGRA